MEEEFRIRIQGADLRVRRRGKFPRTVFLHGFGADLQGWDRVLAALGEDFPTLRYDLRGFGESRADSDTPFSHADDLAALLDALDIASCDLIGESMGGAVAVKFALNYPERVDHLILLSPALVAWEWSARWRELWRPIVERARAGDRDGARALWWRHPLFDPVRETPAGRLVYESIQRYAGEQWIQDNQRPELPDVERLHALEPPTLLLTGERDMEDFRIIADLIQAAVPRVSRVDLPGVGHVLQLEAPSACARWIRAFVAGE